MEHDSVLTRLTNNKLCPKNNDEAGVRKVCICSSGARSCEGLGRAKKNNRRILHSGCKAEFDGIPETIRCRILLFTWSVGALMMRVDGKIFGTFLTGSKQYPYLGPKPGLSLEEVSSCT